jgi:LysR family nitrogen assimilation transcriptional regulator
LKGFVVEIRQLRYFLEIADAGSFSKASQVLHIAQPALSNQIMQLEDELGQQLLHRKHSGVEMTEQGRAFYRHAQRILKELDDLPNIVNQAASDLTGRVAVGLPQSTALRYAVPLLEAVSREHPGIALELFDEISGNLLRGVDSGRLDLAVMVNDRDARLLDAVPLMEEELRFVAAAGRPLPETVRVIDLAQQTLALPGMHHGVRSLVEDAVRMAGAELPSPAIEANSMSIMLWAVESGRACSIMPWGAVSAQLAAGTLQSVPLSPRLARKVYVCSARQGAPSLAAAAVKTVLLNTVREQVLQGAWQGVRLL